MPSVPLLTFAAAIAFATLLPFAQDPQPESTPPKAHEELTRQIRAVRSSVLNSGREAAELADQRLRELEAQLPADADVRADWVRVARIVAVRLGDRARLEALREDHDHLRTELVFAVMHARSQVEHANLDEAKRTLARIGSVDGANEREKRRVWSLQARIAMLEGDVATERHHVENLVDHLHMWPRQRCQECHAQTKAPEQLTGLDLRQLWLGERYVDLMRKAGDAEAVRDTAAAALAADEQDDDARIHLAFALRALGRDDEADRHFRALPWVIFPDRELPKARQMATYP